MIPATTCVLPANPGPGRFEFRHRFHADTFTTFTTTEQNAWSLLRRYMRNAEEWQLVGYRQMVPAGVKS